MTVNDVNKRPRYFAGQYLLEDDFEMEQNYHIDRQQRHNRLLHISGIAEGLNVIQDQSGSLSFKVSPGTAVDKQGRQIVLLNERNVALQPLTDGVHTLFIEYAEKPDPASLQENTPDGYRRILEEPIIGLASSDNSITLANLTVTNSQIIKVDESVRQYSGLRLLGAENSEVTLRYVGDKNSRLARLDGSLSVTGNLSVGGKITPSVGNGNTNGIIFPENPGGGGGDAAWIKYYARTTVGDACTLEIGTSNEVEDHIALMPSGNVGIGTTSPTEKLTVNGNLSVSGAINFAASNRQMLNLWQQAHGIGVQNSTTYFRSSQNFAWYAGGSHNDAVLNAGGGTVQMVISNGNVGIGTASPTEKLTVSGNISASNITVNGTGTSSFAGSLSVSGNLSVRQGSIEFNSLNYVGRTEGNQMLNLWQKSYGIGVQSWTTYFRTGKNFAWYAGGSHNDEALNAGGGTVQMVISNGNVGIGTTSPTEKLTVSGNISAVNISVTGKISGEGTTPVGSVIAYAGSTAPNGWLLCDGAAVSRETYKDLFAVIQTVYGNGDNRSTFNLPDLRGRTIVASGQGANLSKRELGKQIGAETHLLTTDEMPSHNHTANITASGNHSHTGTTGIANPKFYRTVGDNGLPDTQTANNHQRGWKSGGNVQDYTDAGFSNGDHTHNFTISSSGAHTHDVSISPTGRSNAHNNMQPSLVLNYIIKY